jgi:hypothetical protein
MGTRSREATAAAKTERVRVERANAWRKLSTKGAISLAGLMIIFKCDIYDQLAAVGARRIKKYEQRPAILKEIREHLKTLGCPLAP